MPNRHWQARIWAPVAILVFVALSQVSRAAVDIAKLPRPTGYVSDLANVVDPSHQEQLEAFCTQVEQQLGVQFALVTINSTDDRPIRDFALDLFRTWGVGDKKNNQGVLLLLAIKDHQSDIETGRGIEPYLTDGFSGSTLRAMRPTLRSSDYGGALLTAAQSMAEQMAQGKGIPFSGAAPPEEAPQAGAHGGRGIPFPLILLGIFLLLWLFSRGGGRRGGGGYRGGGGAGSFLTGMILGNLLGGRGGGFGGGGGGWGGGGFGGGGGGWGGGGFGGGSGGGGGFGGFGGGDAGGGGASSNW